MLRSVGEQIVDDIALVLAEAGRPSDDVELVVVAFADGLRAVLDQEANGLEGSFSAAKCSGVAVSPSSANVRFRAALEEA